MISCIVFGINSSRNAGWKTVIVLGFTSHYYSFPPALLALLIPNTTANHTITYTNTIEVPYEGHLSSLTLYNFLVKYISYCNALATGS